MKRKQWFYKGKDGKAINAYHSSFPHRMSEYWYDRNISRHEHRTVHRFVNREKQKPYTKYHTGRMTKIIYNPHHGYFFKGYYRYGSRKLTILSGIVAYVRRKRNFK